MERPSAQCTASPNPLKLESSMRECPIIKDEDWLTERELLKFFSEDQALSEIRSLKNITLETFCQVVSHLLNQIDPEIVIDKENYREDLPRHLNNFHYQGKIDETLLSITTKPQVIGVFKFLVDLVQQVGKVNDNDLFQMSSIQGSIKEWNRKKLTKFFSATHLALENNPEQIPELISGMIQDRLRTSLQSNLQKREENEILKLQVHKLNDEVIIFDENKSEESYRLDTETMVLNQKIARLKEVIAESLTQTAKIQQEAEALAQNIKELETEHDELLIMTAAMSPEELSDLTFDKAELFKQEKKNAMKDLSLVYSSTENEYVQLERKCNEILAEISAKLASYTEGRDKLSFDPSSLDTLLHELAMAMDEDCLSEKDKQLPGLLQRVKDKRKLLVSLHLAYDSLCRTNHFEEEMLFRKKCKLLFIRDSLKEEKIENDERMQQVRVQVDECQKELSSFEADALKISTCYKEIISEFAKKLTAFLDSTGTKVINNLREGKKLFKEKIKHLENVIETVLFIDDVSV